MADPKKQKIKLLKIMEILRRKTDKDHPISTKQLIAELEKLGISADRRTVYSDIETMQGHGYDVHKERRGHDMVYYVPKRLFDLPEIKIIMDCVHSSKFVTTKKTEELIEKLADLGGSSRAKLIDRHAIHFDTLKHSNEEIYEIVDLIERAIQLKLKISFNYFYLDIAGERKYKHDKMLYSEEPISMVCSDGDYYVLCYHPELENEIKAFRLDRIENISILKEPVSAECASSLRKARKYSQKAFKLYNGRIENVTLQFDEDLIRVIYDKFGEDTKITKIRSSYKATVSVSVSATFWGWMLQFPGKMKIAAPKELKQEYRNWVISALEEDDRMLIEEHEELSKSSSEE